MNCTSMHERLLFQIAEAMAADVVETPARESYPTLWQLSLLAIAFSLRGHRLAGEGT